MRLALKIIFTFHLLTFTFLCVNAQVRMGIAYYDLSRLYDTIPSLFYNDTDYTPEGRLRWNTERYNKKVNDIAAVIDSMRMPLVVLWGVENEAVVRDISAACKGGYTYLHRTLNSFDGMDFALLYYGDMIFPAYNENGRRYLYVEARIRRDTIGIVMCSDARMAEWVVRDLREDRPNTKLIVAGRCVPQNLVKFGMNDALEHRARRGHGNVYRRAGWLMRDRILADTALRKVSGDVFARRYLVDPKNGYPRSTYTKNRYDGGISYALPVFIYFE